MPPPGEQAPGFRRRRTIICQLHLFCARFYEAILTSRKPGRTEPAPPALHFEVFLCSCVSCFPAWLSPWVPILLVATLPRCVHPWLVSFPFRVMRIFKVEPPGRPVFDLRRTDGAPARPRAVVFPVFFPLRPHVPTRIVTRVRGDMPKGFPAIFVGWGNSLPSPPVRRGTTDPRPPRPIERKWIHEDEKSKAAELGR